jgi:uncharacterized protein (DUF849 family)
MNYDELMLFVVKQRKLTGCVVTCYEAGALGVHLHRRLEELATLLVEVCGKKPTGFIREQGVHTNNLPSGQMILNSLMGEW